MTTSQHHFLSTLILWDNDINNGTKLCDAEKTLILNVLLSNNLIFTSEIRKQLNIIRNIYLPEYGKSYVNIEVGNFTETYNFRELAHISGNYAISCETGYQGNFLDWYNGLSTGWRTIANR